MIAITPLIVVFFAYSIAQGLIYAYADSGATVSTNSTSILIVLMFGVGTDYCLLLVSRYREELRRIEDKHDAMARAVRRAGPAILASGLTVTLAMLVLALADNRGTQLARAGRRDRGSLRVVRRPHPAARPADDVRSARFLAEAQHGRLRPRARIGRASGALAALRRQGPDSGRGWRWSSQGWSSAPAPSACSRTRSTTRRTSFFKHSVESVSGFDVLRQAFPAGTLAPTTVLVQSDNGPVTPADIAEAQQKLRAVKGVAAVGRPCSARATGGSRSSTLILQGDPANKSALDIVPEDAGRRREPVAGRHGARGGQQRDQLRHRQRESAATWS